VKTARQLKGVPDGDVGQPRATRRGSDGHTTHLDEITARIERVIAGHEQDLDNLDTIPGIGRAAAQIVIAESGKDGASLRRRPLKTANLKRLLVYYRRIAARRGRQRALVAVMHKLTIAIWHVLHDHVPYQDLGMDHFTKRNPERAMRRMTTEANSLGLTIRFDPITAA
jgi:hypothetical protein